MFKKQLITVAVLVNALHGVAADVRDGDDWFSLNAAFGFNVKASFQNHAAPPPNPGPATGSQASRSYDNGYVRVDVSDNVGGQTTWWKFDEALGAGYDGLPGGALTLTSTRSPAQGASFAGQESSQLGIDFVYSRRLFRCGDSDAPWMLVGIETGFTWLDLVLRNTASVAGTSTTVDAFHLAPGNVVLGTSFEGNYLGDPPGPLLNAEPSRSLIAGMARVNNSLEGKFWGIRLGPVFEIPVGHRTLISLSGGLAVAGVEADYTWFETVIISGGAPTITSGSGDISHWNVGGYVKGEMGLLLGKGWSVQTGVQYANVGHFQTLARQYSARLDLRDTLQLTAGLAYTF